MVFAHNVNPAHFHSISGYLHNLGDSFVLNPVFGSVKVAATAPAPRTESQGLQANISFLRYGICQTPGLILDGAESDGVQREEQLIDESGRVFDPFRGDQLILSI